MYEVKRNRSSYHIDGIACRTKSTGEDTGRGYVAYYAESACGALTRGRFEIVGKFEDLAEALAKAELGARVYNMKLCRNCEKAAQELLAAAAPADPLAELVQAARAAAEGDSNDGEIQALQAALDEALAQLNRQDLRAA